MHILSDSYQDSLWLTYLLGVILIINPLSHLFENIFSIGNTYYTSYICWAVLLAFFVCILRKKLKVKELVITLVLAVVFLVGTINGDSTFGHGIDGLHVSFFICVSYICMNGFSNSPNLNRNQIHRLFRLILVISIISYIYAFVFQYNHFTELIKGNNIPYNSWMYVSFFRQRNIFAAYSYLAAFSAFFLYNSTRKRIYLICLLICIFQIYLTHSRTALMATLVMITMYFYMKHKNTNIIYVCFITMVAMYFYAFNRIDDGNGLFFHQAEGGVDSGLIRLFMWRDCIELLVSDTSFLYGYGMGAIGHFLLPSYSVGSSHNSFIDVLFDGGITFLFLQLTTLKKIISLTNNLSDYETRITYLSFEISFLFNSLLEAGMILYASNFFSLTATLLLVYIPSHVNKEAK